MGRLSDAAGVSDAADADPAETSDGAGTKGPDGGTFDDRARARLEAWLAPALGAARVSVDDARLLGGGAIQQNVALELRVHGVPSGARADPLSAVLRRDAPATIHESRGRAEEHALLVAAHAAGVTVPRPLAFCADVAVAGAPFSVVARVAGTALGQQVVKDPGLGGDREALVERLGSELARIHAMDPGSPDLGFLAAEIAEVRQIGDAPLRAVGRLRDSLDALGEVRPALEAGLRWLELRRPVAREHVLVHRDFRTGNFMLDASGLTAVLDWEFAGVGDPFEDLGWFCARCWRFSRPDLEAGGLGTRAAFYRGYERAGGRAVDDASVRWWERLAHLRWATIALQQGARHASGRERSLSLALTGELAHALELHVLDLALTDGLRVDAPGDRPKGGSTAVPDDAPEDDSAAVADRLDLLAVARETLADVAAHAAGEQRLAVLMSAAAVGSVERALAHARRLEGARRTVLHAAGAATPARLVQALRAGDHDGRPAPGAAPGAALGAASGSAPALGPALGSALLRECALRAWVARPGDVGAALRARHGLLPGDGPPV